MSETAEALELELADDLATLGERFADDEFSTELYRALTNNVWRKTGGPQGHVSLSWGRAEKLVNDLRSRNGQQSLTLAQTGAEGDVSDVVAGELAGLGWRAQPLNTSRRDPQHLDRPESAPPAEHGEREGPADDATAWERRAHDEADRPADAAGEMAPGS